MTDDKIPIIDSRKLPNSWRIVDDKTRNFRSRGLPFRYSYVGSFAQSLAEFFVRVYSNPGDTILDPFCVTKDSVVLLNQHDRIRIDELYKDINKTSGQTNIFGENIEPHNNFAVGIDNFHLDKTFNKDEKEKNRKQVLISSFIEKAFLKENKETDIYQINTRNRRILKASSDHVFLTKKGNNLEWKKLKDIKSGDRVAICPSVIPLDNSVKEEIVILTEKDILENMPDKTQSDYLLMQLKERGLLPLTNRHPKLHIIARICGFLMTDGSMSEFERRNYDENYTNVHIHFASGNMQTLDSIYYDFKNLCLDMDCNFTDVKEKLTYEGTKNPVRCGDLEIGSKSTFTFLKALGVPIGKKTIQSFDIPKWINSCSKRVKQEFLGGFFGGDGFAINYYEGKNLSGVGFAQSKIPSLKESLFQYAGNIQLLLKEFGIEFNKYYLEEQKSGEGTIITYNARFDSSQRNTLKFLKYIGYRYDTQKIESAYHAYEYLLSKELRIGIENNKRHLPFPNFMRWKREYVLNDIVFDDVITVKKINYTEELYDLQVKDINNYIVNEFVTHNSGRGSVAMNTLYHDRNMVCNDLSPYSNTLCHSILWVPRMKDVLDYIDILEDYIEKNGDKIPTNYEGKGTDNDTGKLYHPKTFDQIIKLRNLLNSKKVLLGKLTDIYDDEYEHEIVMFIRASMTQLILGNSQTLSFNGLKLRGTDNTNVRALLRYYDKLGEKPQNVDIFERIKLYVEKMNLDSLGLKDKFSKLNRMLICCDAKKLDLPDKSIDGVVTSPPYMEILSYGMMNWARFWILDNIGDPLVKPQLSTETETNSSETFGKTYDKVTDLTGSTLSNPMYYSRFTGQYLKELYRVLKDDSFAIIVVGDYGQKKKMEVWKLVSDRAKIIGFKPVMIILDTLNVSTKSSSQFNAKQGGGKNDQDVCVVLFKGNYVQKNKPEDIDFRWGANFVDTKQKSIDDAWGL